MASSADRAYQLLCALIDNEDGVRWGDRATPQQHADAKAVFDPDGPRRHWLGRSRGYNKTGDGAAMSVAWLPELSTGAEAIAVAADRDQARLLTDRMRRITQLTPELRGAFTCGAYDVRVGNVRLECLPADASSAWDRSPAWATVDELCQWAATANAQEMWSAISTAIPKVRGRLLILTTAGDPSHWSRGVYENAVTDRLWRVSEMHGPAPWLDPEELEGERRRLPDSAWQRFFENRWCATEDRLLSFEDLEACALLPGRLDADPRHSYVLGVDLAVRSDNAVVAVCHCEEIEEYGDRRVVVDSLDVFTPSKHRENDLQAVEDCVRARSAQYGGAAMVFDPSQGFSMMQRLRALGHRVEEHTHTAQSNSRRALLILELVRGRRLWLPGDSDTVSEFAAVRLRETSPGVYRYDHDAGKHDDRVTEISLAALQLLDAPMVDLTNFVGSRHGFFPEAPGSSKWAGIMGADATGSIWSNRPARQIQPRGIGGAAVNSRPHSDSEEVEPDFSTYNPSRWGGLY